MGLGGISIWQLLIILVIVVLLFGTKRLSTLGGDLGSAIRGFRKSMKDDEDTAATTGLEQANGESGQTFDATSSSEEKSGS